MRRDFHRAVLLEYSIVREHAVNAAAQRAFVHVRRRLAAAPALEKIARNTVADFKLRHAWTGLDHLAGAVRQRNHVLATGMR